MRNSVTDMGGLLVLALLLAADGDTVPFELKDGLVVVQVKVNGMGPFRFGVDTGSAATVLSPATASTLGIEKETELKSISVGKAEATRVPLAVRAGPHDGILGTTFLSRFSVTIDYAAKKLTLVPAAVATLGFSYRTIPDDLANEIGLEGGVEVRAIAAGGPAAKGGLKKGDLIREMNGKRIDTADQYRALLDALKPGDAVVLKVVRDRKDLELKLSAAERP